MGLRRSLQISHGRGPYTRSYTRITVNILRNDPTSRNDPFAESKLMNFGMCQVENSILHRVYYKGLRLHCIDIIVKLSEASFKRNMYS